MKGKLNSPQPVHSIEARPDAGPPRPEPRRVPLHVWTGDLLLLDTFLQLRARFATIDIGRTVMRFLDIASIPECILGAMSAQVIRDDRGKAAAKALDGGEGIGENSSDAFLLVCRWTDSCKESRSGARARVVVGGDHVRRIRAVERRCNRRKVG